MFNSSSPTLTAILIQYAAELYFSVRLTRHVIRTASGLHSRIWEALEDIVKAVCVYAALVMATIILEQVFFYGPVNPNNPEVQVNLLFLVVFTLMGVFSPALHITWAVSAALLFRSAVESPVSAHRLSLALLAGCLVLLLGAIVAWQISGDMPGVFWGLTLLPGLHT